MPSTPRMMSDMRVFVAVDPPDEMVEDLDAFLDARRDAGEGLRWTPPSQWHLTLAFMAAAPERVVEDLVDHVAEAAARRAPVQLALAGGGCFPDVSRARVLWAGVRAGRTWPRWPGPCAPPAPSWVLRRTVGPSGPTSPSPGSRDLVTRRVGCASSSRMPVRRGRRARWPSSRPTFHARKGTGPATRCSLGCRSAADPSTVLDAGENRVVTASGSTSSPALTSCFSNWLAVRPPLELSTTVRAPTRRARRVGQVRWRAAPVAGSTDDLGGPRTPRSSPDLVSRAVRPRRRPPRPPPRLRA